MTLYSNPDGSLACDADGFPMEAPTQAEFEACCCGPPGPTPGEPCADCLDGTPAAYTITVHGLKQCFYGQIDWCGNDIPIVLTQSPGDSCSWVNTYACSPPEETGGGDRTYYISLTRLGLDFILSIWTIIPPFGQEVLFFGSAASGCLDSVLGMANTIAAEDCGGGEGWWGYDGTADIVPGP